MISGSSVNTLMAVSISMFDGVPYINILTDDFVIPQPLLIINNDTIILAIGSAKVNPQIQMMIAATIAPTEPNRSPKTCKKAPRILILSLVSPPLNISVATMTLTIKPITLIMNISVDWTSIGLNIRFIASIIIIIPITNNVTPLNN